MLVLGISLLGLCLASCNQTASGHLMLGKDYAINELTFALKNNNDVNLIDNKTIIIRDSLTAVSVAEPILFSIYGRANILR